ncbi:MAG: 30S ribosomal protein S5 [Patescibacteria group bacterium]|nr:30S ribosomal protein S5 [Patescibacteria group bacterium]
MIHQRTKRIVRQKSEFQEKVLEIRRVTRVVAGGKRFSFRATVIIGDQKGKLGLGIAKGLDVASAIQKAKTQARKNLVSVSLKDSRTIFYDTEAKYGAARVRLKPARLNHGLIAGGACRVVLELVGIKDISAKILGRTTNKIANARATIKALRQIKVQNVNIKTKEQSPK